MQSLVSSQESSLTFSCVETANFLTVQKTQSLNFIYLLIWPWYIHTRDCVWFQSKKAQFPNKNKSRQEYHWVETQVNSVLGHINITIILARRSIGNLNWVFMFPSFTCANKSSFCGSFHVETCLTRAMLHIDFVLSIYKIVLYTFLLKIVLRLQMLASSLFPVANGRFVYYVSCEVWKKWFNKEKKALLTYIEICGRPNNQPANLRALTTFWSWN